MIYENIKKIFEDSALSNYSKILYLLKISIIIVIILTPPIFFIEHDVKYALYFFSLILTGLIILIIFNKNFEFYFTFPSLRIIDYSFVFLSIVLLGFNFFQNFSFELPYILSIIVSLFLLGWVFTRLLGFEKSNSNLSLIVISFCLSLGLTSLLFLFSLTTETLSALPYVFVGISLLPLIKDRFMKHKKIIYNNEGIKRKHNIFDALILIWIISFFLFFLASIYPEVLDVPGRDTVRHFLQTNRHILTPENYGSNYPWFHHLWGTIFQMSFPSTTLFLTGLPLLSIFLIFSFYIMSKTYLREIDKRAHLLATVFFSVFSGFGWMYFVKNKMTYIFQSIPLESERILLNSARGSSWWDIGSGEGMWLLMDFRPITLGFILFFVILFLMKRYDISKRNFMIIVSFLAMTLGQIHLPEFVFFTVFLFFMAIFVPNIKVRLKETCLSFFFGSLAFSAVTLLSRSYFGSEVPQSSLFVYFVFLPIITLIAYLLTSFPNRPKISLKFNYSIISLVIVSIFIILLIHWFSNVDNFIFSEVQNILAVPWEFYPVLLGLTGIFGIIGGIIVFKKYSGHPIGIFIILMIVGIIFGRFLTFLNANVLETGYFERRIIPFVFVSVAMLSPLFILKLMNINFTWGFLKKTKVLWKVIVISLIVVVGIFSTVLTIEYQILSVQNNMLSQEEHRLVESLQEVEPDSTILTVTPRTMRVAEYGVVGQILDAKRFLLWDWITPEMPLNAISSLDSQSIIFLNEMDKNRISLIYSDTYLGSHIVPFTPFLKENEKVLSYMPQISPPLSNSTTVLVLPGDENNFYYAYDFLSLGYNEYTSALLQDIKTIRNAEVLIAPNEKIGLKLVDFKEKYDLKFDKLIIFNLDGYGPLIKSSEKRSSSGFQELDSTTDWKSDGIGKGTSSIPKLEENAYPKGSSKKLISIEVGDGEYGQWTISSSIKHSLDLSNLDLVKLNWKGNKDEKWYVINFISDSKNLFWYKFQDSWSGLKQVVFPTKMVDGKEKIFGVNIEKRTKGFPAWENINEVQILPAASNLNNKGIFYFDGLVFDNYSLFSSIKNASDEKLNFPLKLPIKQNIFSGDFTVLSTYDETIPFLLHKNSNNFDMYYVNVNPIIQKINEGNEDSRKFYSMLGNILEIVDDGLPQYEPKGKNKFRYEPGGFFTYDTFYATGDLTLSSSSMITNVESPLIVNVDGINYNYENISLILPVSVDKSMAKSNDALIENGRGFYSKIVMNSSKILFEGKPAIISITKNDGSIETIKGQNILIELLKSENLIRQPYIQVDGISKFENIEAFGVMDKKLRVSGQDLTIEGTVSFSNKFSDEFLFAHNATIKGNLERSEPIYAYEQLDNFLNLFAFLNH